ncbi:unnamed protein product [marine sediment metagenome]|uniref:N-acetyltransferase domain-containing protein n=1 Tax=marine sediment metagenome TaxID=412755 RepID=X1DFI3_9ZZZZ
MKYLPFVEKIIMNNEKKEKDDSLSDALSALGWIEEEEGKESKEEMPSSLEDQVNFLLKKNKQLEEQNLMLKNYIEQLDSSSSKVEKPEVPNDFESKINEKDGIISNLIVDPSYRGEGLGEELIKYSIDFFKRNHINSVRIIVKTELDESASNLFTKFGFNEIFKVLEIKM